LNGIDASIEVDDDFALEPGKWQYSGGIWVPHPISAVPASVTPGQARIALIRAGKLDAVKAAAQAAGPEAETAFEFATSFDRDSEFLNAIAGPLELDLDSLFTLAASIKL
jgi:hypothetical protein